MKNETKIPLMTLMILQSTRSRSPYNLHRRSLYRDDHRRRSLSPNRRSPSPHRYRYNHYDRHDRDHRCGTRRDCRRRNAPQSPGTSPRGGWQSGQSVAGQQLYIDCDPSLQQQLSYNGRRDSAHRSRSRT